MVKKTIYLILSISLFILSACESQNYKKIIAEEKVELGREFVVDDSVPDEVSLELDSNEIFYPSFFYNGYIYGHIRRINGDDLIKRKYLYRIDVYNKITETVKENLNNMSGVRPIGFIDDEVYTVDYSRRNKINQIRNLSILLNENKKSTIGRQYVVSYALGSENYIIIHKYSSEMKLNDIYIYDLGSNRIYKRLSDKRYGEIAYIKDLNSLIWIDNEDFKIYKIDFINGYYTLNYLMDLDIDENTDRIRAYINNGYELMLLFDSKVVDDKKWDLMETTEIRSYNFRNNQSLTLFTKTDEKKLYFEYLGDNFFLSENFKVLDGYIEVIERKAYYYNYKELNQIYLEIFKEKSQQFYPEINVIASRSGNELFSTREIKEIIDGVPITKKVIYQRIKFDLMNNGKLLQ